MFYNTGKAFDKLKWSPPLEIRSNDCHTFNLVKNVATSCTYYVNVR